MSWINIARVGSFRDMAGRSVDFTVELLRSIAASYDPGRNKAPLVFGHPALNGPAYGWVEELRAVGDVLQARVSEVSDAVRNLVDSGAYRNVSCSFYPDMRLRHVGLLGATPPAIDGLGDVAFAQGEPQGESITIDFSEEDQMTADLQRKIDEATAAIAAKDKEIADLKAASAKLGQDFADYREASAKTAREVRFAALVSAGKILPAQKVEVLAFAESLAKDDRTIDFAEGGQITKLSPEALFWRNLEAKASHGLFSEFATGEKAGDGQTPSGKPAAPVNYASKF